MSSETKSSQQNANTEILSLDNVTRIFSKEIVLNKASFSVKRGDFLAIIGPNGAGKTTLLKIIMGIIKSSSGDVYIKSKKITSRDLDIRHVFGYASQDNSFYDHLSVRENLSYFGRLYWLTTAEIATRSQDIIKLVGLNGHENTQSLFLSSGMKRKLDLACAIIHNPEILILDEPFAGLDPLSVKHLMDILRHLHKIGTTIILASQLLHVVEELCNKIVVISQGKILENKNINQLQQIYADKELLTIQTKEKDYNSILDAIKKAKILTTNQLIKNGFLFIEIPCLENVFSIITIIKESNQEISYLNLGKETLQHTFENIITGKSYRKNTSVQQFEKEVKTQLQSYFKKIRETLNTKNLTDNEIEELLLEVKK